MTPRKILPFTAAGGSETESWGPSTLSPTSAPILY